MKKADGNFEGYCIDLIEELKALMGFDYNLYEVPDDKYGSMDENMEWDGMISELVEKVSSRSCSSRSYDTMPRLF